jgi:hypothetical protein
MIDQRVKHPVVCGDAPVKRDRVDAERAKKPGPNDGAMAVSRMSEPGNINTKRGRGYAGSYWWAKRQAKKGITETPVVREPERVTKRLPTADFKIPKDRPAPSSETLFEVFSEWPRSTDEATDYMWGRDTHKPDPEKALQDHKERCAAPFRAMHTTENWK